MYEESGCSLKSVIQSTSSGDFTWSLEQVHSEMVI